MRANMIALALLTVAYVFSLFAQWRVKREIEPPDTTVLHLAHHHLEAGYREALQVVIEDFEEYERRRGRKVKVIQRAIPERYYFPWLNANIVGGTMPDIVQLPQNWQETAVLQQHFVQLDPLIGKPNPFNDFEALERVMGDVDLHRNVTDTQRQTDAAFAEPLLVREVIARTPADLREYLRNTPIKETFYDGMLGGFNYTLAAYYSFPTSAATDRLFYNKRLFAEAGYDEPPRTLGQFLDLCERLTRLRGPDDRPIVPIAAYKGADQVMIHSRYSAPFTYRLGNRFDWDLTAAPPDIVVYGGWQVGLWDFQEPSLKAYYQCARRIASYCTPGFLAMERDQATFSFSQEQAAMVPAPTFDAANFFRTARFEVGVMNFPMPGPEDPQGWYRFADQRPMEGIAPAGLFALNSRGDHVDLAERFVQLLTSFVWNERFNRLAELVPAVKGTEPAERLLPFKPSGRGVSRGMVPDGSSDNSYLTNDYRGYFWIYLSGQIPDDQRAYERFVSQLEASFADPQYGIDRLWSNAWDGERRGARLEDGRIHVNTAVQLLEGRTTERQLERYHRDLMRNAQHLNGSRVRLRHDQVFRDQPRPFPSF